VVSQGFIKPQFQVLQALLGFWLLVQALAFAWCLQAIFALGFAKPFPGQLVRVSPSMSSSSPKFGAIACLTS
jgi:hypothetical protein